MVACRGGSRSGESGLAVYVDEQLQLSEGRDALRKRTPDYTRGGLQGWRLYGGLVRDGDAATTAVLEVVGGGGSRVRVERPAQRYPGLEPVVLVDRDGSLRFALVPPGGADASHDPLTVTAITELHVTRGPALASFPPPGIPGGARPPGAPPMAGKQAQTPADASAAAFDLV